MKKLILASGSPTRKKLFTEAGLIFEIDASNYEEDMSLLLSPQELAKHLSRGKAEDVASRHEQAVVVGADTFVVYDDKILGKPHTPDRAREMLKMLSGKQHLVITGFTIIDVEQKSDTSVAVETKVFFRDLSDTEIDDYIATGEPLNKAGSYGILENGWKFVENIIGSKSNIAGLPMDEVIESLKSFNIYN
jgi:septum formation protein